MSVKTTGKVLVENYFWNLQESAEFLGSISLCPSLDLYDAKSLLLLWDGLSSFQHLEAFESLAVKGFFSHSLMARFVLGSWRTSKNILPCVLNFLTSYLFKLSFFFTNFWSWNIIKKRQFKSFVRTNVK